MELNDVYQGLGAVDIYLLSSPATPYAPPDNIIAIPSLLENFFEYFVSTRTWPN